MPSIGVMHPSEKSRLDSCSQRFAPMAWAAYNAINRACASTTCVPLVVYGLRSRQEQLTIWMDGRELIANGADIWKASSWRVVDPKQIKTRAFPGMSAHNSGDAVDIALIEGEGIHRHWLPGDDPRWRTIIQATCRNLGLRWGGEFKGLYDAAHIEHPEWAPPKE